MVRRYGTVDKFSTGMRAADCPGKVAMGTADEYFRCVVRSSYVGPVVKCP